MGRTILLGMLVLLIFGAAAAAMTYARWVEALEPANPTAPDAVLVQVKPGSSTADTAVMLEEEGLIRASWAFVLLSRVRGRDDQIRAGWYALDPGMTPERILDLLVRGETATRQFTIPEGLTVDAVIARLVEHGLGSRDAFWEAVGHERAAQRIESLLPEDYAARTACPEHALPASVLEGYLFPDTYTVEYDASELEIVLTMLDRFWSHWNEERAARAEELGLTPHQVMTLASIVEREAQVDEERPKVASVFLNRLDREMTLGACSTVLYVQGRTSGPVLDEDTDIDSPYNTYRAPALPPGPIASPGGASIDAVLHPTTTEYLYFVSRGDGTHAFARTYSEHLQNAAKYGE